jgi:glycosyltransferase involved in cell wall biosynthesis
MEKEPFNLSIVIPVYNEEGLLSTSINDLIKRMEKIPVVYEIIISENGSRDRTKEIAKELSETKRNVRTIHSEEPNYGKALRRGILQARGEVVVCDEIDICDTNFYRKALDLIVDSGFDMVIGSKLHPDARDKRPFFRHFATIIINLLLRIFLGFRGTDTHGLKAFRREAILPVVDRCLVDRDLFQSELVIRAERMNKKIREIPVAIVEKRKPSINLFRRVPNVLKNLMKLYYYIKIKG